MLRQHRRQILRPYQRLDAWQHSMDLVIVTYDITSRFPADERFGLTAQLRRASVSIPSNIAEGNERDTVLDHRRFLTSARSSVSEVETQFQIAHELDYITKLDRDDLFERLDHVGRMVANLKRNVRR